MIRRRRLVGAVTVVMLLAGCGVSVAGRPATAGDAVVILGSTDSAESALIGEIYAAALVGNGIPVVDRRSFDTGEAAARAVQDGTIDVLIGYTGPLLQHYDPQATATRPDDVFQGLQAAVPDGLVVLEMAPAENKRALAIPRFVAQHHQIGAIGDLWGRAQQMRLAGPSDPTSLAAGLERVYHLRFAQSAATTAGDPLELLRTGESDIVVVTTSDPGLLPRGVRQFDLFFTRPVSSNDPECRAQCGAVLADLRNDDRVESVAYFSQDDVLADYRERYSDEPAMLEIVRKEALSAYLRILVGDPADLSAVAARHEDADGVESINEHPPLDPVVLQDPKALFGAGNVVPVASTDTATDHVRTVLNAVSAQLTTVDLIALNDRVVNRHRELSEVAAEWVSDNGLG